jgi:hypothetical protein
MWSRDSVVLAEDKSGTLEHTGQTKISEHIQNHRTGPSVRLLLVHRSECCLSGRTQLARSNNRL